jgi:signal transduction histidine kinase
MGADAAAPVLDRSSHRDKSRSIQTALLNRDSERERVAMLAHELRRRLGAIRVLIEAITLLHERGRDPQPMIDRFFGEMHDLDALRDTLLAEPCRSTRANLVDAARAAVRTVGTALGVEIALHAPGQAVWVSADPILTRQAIENLVDNAARHGGSPVEVTVRRAGGGHWGEAVVADRGPGLAAVAPPRPESGHGLGLMLVRRVVASFGGRTWAESRSGGGAVFGVRLPVAAGRTHRWPVGAVAQTIAIGRTS